MSTEPARPRRLLRWQELRKRYGKSRTQTWRDVRAGKFPPPVQIGPNSIAWWSDELDAHDETLLRVAWAPDEIAAMAAPENRTPATRSTLPGSDSFSQPRSIMEPEPDEDMRKSPRNQA